MANRKRPKLISFHVSDEEKDIIDFKIKMSNLPKGEFFREMITNGEVIKKDTEKELYKLKVISSLTKEVNKIGTNINQIAKHTNQTGSITNSEYQILESRIDEIWQLLKSKLFDL